LPFVVVGQQGAAAEWIERNSTLFGISHPKKPRAPYPASSTH
jgi:hypothetical protein